MKIILFILLFLMNSGLLAQTDPAQDSLFNHRLSDSLNAIVDLQKENSNEVTALIQLSVLENDNESSIRYARKGLILAQKINDKKGEGVCLFIIGNLQNSFGQSIQYTLSALKVFESIQDFTGIVHSLLSLQSNYRDAGYYRNALENEFLGLHIVDVNNLRNSKNELRPPFSIADSVTGAAFLVEIAQTYILMKQLDSAMFYTHRAMEEKLNSAKDLKEFSTYLLATIQEKEGNYSAAINNYRMALEMAVFYYPIDTLQIYSGMSTYFLHTGNYDSAIFYAQKVAKAWKFGNSETKNILEAAGNLVSIYKLKGNKDSLIRYIEYNQALNDSFYSKSKDREVQGVAFNERLNQEEIHSAQEKYKSKIQFYLLGMGLLALLIIAGLQWRSNLKQQKSKMQIEKAFSELKTTQTQLIQSEKMASLGELTAGIAHEIQNPLNFVNNFSEINRDLAEEMKREIVKGNLQEVNEIADNILLNEEKILHHGKRADAIVKGMLQHSKINTGIKEPVNINLLTEEYLRIAYNGENAKHKDFRIELKTDFDPGVQNIQTNPQDLGKVLLNLYHNAFYYVAQKRKSNLVGYIPTIFVSTKKSGNKLEIKVKDNGNGIPSRIMDKIFQPFFTTKPPGQGTGLGLSLSYDIVHAHGGEIKVQTREGEFTEFTVVLPY